MWAPKSITFVKGTTTLKELELIKLSHHEGCCFSPGRAIHAKGAMYHAGTGLQQETQFLSYHKRLDCGFSSDGKVARFQDLYGHVQQAVAFTHFSAVKLRQPWQSIQILIMMVLGLST